MVTKAMEAEAWRMGGGIVAVVAGSGAAWGAKYVVKVAERKLQDPLLYCCYGVCRRAKSGWGFLARNIPFVDTKEKKQWRLEKQREQTRKRYKQMFVDQQALILEEYRPRMEDGEMEDGDPILELILHKATEALTPLQNAWEAAQCAKDWDLSGRIRAQASEIQLILYGKELSLRVQANQLGERDELAEERQRPGESWDFTRNGILPEYERQVERLRAARAKVQERLRAERQKQEDFDQLTHDIRQTCKKQDVRRELPTHCDDICIPGREIMKELKDEQSAQEVRRAKKVRRDGTQ